MAVVIVLYGRPGRLVSLSVYPSVWVRHVVVCLYVMAVVWAENDSCVVWFVKLGVSWLMFALLSVVDSGFVFDISY